MLNCCFRSTVPWRTVGVRYTTNEVYFDIIEELDATVDRNGHVVRCSVAGTISVHHFKLLCQEMHLLSLIPGCFKTHKVNCKLSGMPDLTLVFYNPRILDDVAFHPCVRYSRWDQSKILSFIPPDGHFKLMQYRYHFKLSLSSLQLPPYHFRH